MQQAVKQYAEEVRRSEGVAIQIRVGLNAGEVVVRSIGSDLRMDYTAVGQTTHLAARMEQLATPGSILMTADGLRLAEGYMTAAWRRTSGMVNNSLTFNQVTSNAPLDPDVVTQKMRWFKNIKRQPFDAGQESLDYSLQLHDGIENFCASNASACNSR